MNRPYQTSSILQSVHSDLTNELCHGQSTHVLEVNGNGRLKLAFAVRSSEAVTRILREGNMNMTSTRVCDRGKCTMRINLSQTAVPDWLVPHLFNRNISSLFILAWNQMKQKTCPNQQSSLGLVAAVRDSEASRKYALDKWPYRMLLW